MALKFTLSNILQFYTFLSPIFIPLFLLIKSTMDYNIKGLIYLVGLFFNYMVGILVKSLFYHMDSKSRALGETPQFERQPVRMKWPLHPGQTARGVPDYCSVFEGPWFTSALGATSMPSLNAMFHAFTLLYIIMGTSTNPNTPGIPLIIVLAITAITNMVLRVRLFCDRMTDVGIGLILGSALGVAWYFIINSWNPIYVYYGKDDPTKQCKLGKTKFKCSYN